ncbi:partial 3-dehydro-bile acid delta(4,6)-reductase, partial [Candidatus Brocadiaceae bacterium]
TSYKVEIQATRGWNEAEFTAGGIDTKEVKESTLESKLVNGLYFCGEILDVDGDVGGFNLSWAWSSGNTAGKLKGSL